MNEWVQDINMSIQIILYILTPPPFYFLLFNFRWPGDGEKGKINRK